MRFLWLGAMPKGVLPNRKTVGSRALTPPLSPLLSARRFFLLSLHLSSSSRRMVPALFVRALPITASARFFHRGGYGRVDLPPLPRQPLQRALVAARADLDGGAIVVFLAGDNNLATTTGAATARAGVPAVAWFVLGRQGFGRGTGVIRRLYPGASGKAGLQLSDALLSIPLCGGFEEGLEEFAARWEKRLL